MENVLVLGKGAREHCISEFLSKSGKVSTVFVFPGNDGMEMEKIKKVYIKDDFESIFNFCQENKINYVFPSTETYLVSGIVDFLTEKGVKCFGPTKENAKIEGCKIFSKNLMIENNIPTPTFQVFTCLKDANEVVLENNESYFVIKNPNLAGGKGVFLPENTTEALEIINNLFKSNEKIIIEEKVSGEEVSCLFFCNGKEAFSMPDVMDYKKLYDSESGPNTGGMGSIGPVNTLSEEEKTFVTEKVNLLVGKLNYKGVLYAGLIKTTKGVLFLEFNCRFGDPETQVILNLLKSDLFEIISNCISGEKVVTEWEKTSCLNLVLSEKNYPYKSNENPIEIKMEKLDPSVKMYSGNLEFYSDRIFSQGGRILNLTVKGDNPCKNFTTLYNNTSKISYQNKYFRKDIGIPFVKNKIGKNLKVAILGSGMGTSPQKLISNCKKLNVSIEVIISDKKNSGILQKALRENISCFYLNPRKEKSWEDYDTKLINILKIFDVDLIILCGYMKILTKKFVQEYEKKTMNVHPSLLPKYKGMMDMGVHEKVIKNKEKVSGCTIHYVTEEVDSGEIILQKQYLIRKNETPETLKSAIQELESDAIIEAINIFRERKIDYKFSGVDIDEGEKVVDMIKSLTPQLKEDIGHFGCIYNFNNMKLATSTDGVGSKLEIAIETKIYDTVGIDLVAMVVNDLYCCGAKPLFFLDYLAMDRVDSLKSKEIIKGINLGCEIADCKLVGGETAEMKSIYFKDKFDLAGFGVGIVENPLPGKIETGDLIYGISSSGLHSNGFSLVRKILKSSSYDLSKILKPTRIYNEVPKIQEKYEDKLLGVSHITGGGITENLPRILPRDLSFKLKDWEFPEIFKWVQKESSMSREEMMRVFNCGWGMLLVFKKETQIDDDFLVFLGEIV